jgi:hypothetical protein
MTDLSANRVLSRLKMAKGIALDKKDRKALREVNKALVKVGYSLNGPMTELEARELDFELLSQSSTAFANFKKSKRPSSNNATASLAILSQSAWRLPPRSLRKTEIPTLYMALNSLSQSSTIS